MTANCNAAAANAPGRSKGAAAAALLAVAMLAGLAGARPARTGTRAAAEHPRLFFSSEDLPHLRAKAQGKFMGAVMQQYEDAMNHRLNYSSGGVRQRDRWSLPARTARGRACIRVPGPAYAPPPPPPNPLAPWPLGNDIDPPRCPRRVAPAAGGRTAPPPLSMPR